MVLQGFGDISVRREAGEVVQFVRVGLQVVEAVLDVSFGGGIFFGVRLRDDAILPAAGAKRASDWRLARLDEDPLSPPFSFAFQVRSEHEDRILAEAEALG